MPQFWIAVILAAIVGTAIQKGFRVNPLYFIGSLALIFGLYVFASEGGADLSNWMDWMNWIEKQVDGNEKVARKVARQVAAGVMIGLIAGSLIGKLVTTE